MADRSKIEWTDATWNPIRGCSRVSEGCRNCYAERVAARFSGPGQPYEGLAEHTPSGPRWTGKVRLIEERLHDPLRWRKPRKVFVNSMSDLFHESALWGYIDRIFAIMALAPHHTFQVLTKRPEQMHAYCRTNGLAEWLWSIADRIACQMNLPESHPSASYLDRGKDCALWPLPNVWLGVSIENQETANERIPKLLGTPAAVRFVSAEPLLGRVNLMRIPIGDGYCRSLTADHWTEDDIGFKSFISGPTETIDWVIVNGESGPSSRPMHPDWARSLRDQCATTGVPFFFKQWGAWAWADEAMTFHEAAAHAAGREVEYHISGHTAIRVGAKTAGRALDGRTHDDFPDASMCAAPRTPVEKDVDKQARDEDHYPGGELDDA